MFRQSMFKKIVLASALVVFVSVAFAASQKVIPLLLPVQDMKFKIVDATFVTELRGTNATFTESETDKFRGLVLTVELTKPAGQELTLIAQDITIHYKYGQKADVARCQGISTFSGQVDSDRAMSLYNNVGRSTTGTSTTKASTVYVDLFFHFMEPDTSEINLCIAQPVGASITTNGWEK